MYNILRNHVEVKRLTYLLGVDLLEGRLFLNVEQLSVQLLKLKLNQSLERGHF